MLNYRWTIYVHRNPKVNEAVSPEVRERLSDQVMDEYRLPVNGRESIRRWILFGDPPGGFLRAVFRGELFPAAYRADLENQRNLANIALYVYHKAPALAIGEHYDSWKGLVDEQGNPRD